MKPQLNLPVLYSFRRCPFAMRARLALAAAGQAVEIREIVLRDKPAHLRELSPKATVPVLWLPDGTVIDQSLDIMRWAVAQQWPHTWLDCDARQREQGEAWLQMLDGPFKQALDRYKYPNRYEGCDPMAERTLGRSMLAVWDAHLQRGQHWLFGPQPSLYDCAILPFVRQFRIADEAWFDSGLQLPALQGWLARFLASPWFEQVMVKLDPWTPEGPPRQFP